MQRPMPDVEPVTRATRFFSDMGEILWVDVLQRDVTGEAISKTERNLCANELFFISGFAVQQFSD